MGKVDWIWLFLKPSGRLTRWPYFLATMFINVVASYFVYRHVLSYYPANAQDLYATPGLYELAYSIWFITIWPMVALSAKRCQDIGLSPFVGALIAFLGIVLLVILTIVPGKDGPNKYGAIRDAPPAPRS